jgi:hypothetical protein
MATKKATPKPLYQRVIERVEAQVIQLTAKVEKYERMDQSDINDVLDRIGKVVDNKQAGFIVSVGKEIATMLKRVGNAERGVSKAFNHLGKVEQCCRDQAAAIDAQGKLLHELAGQHAVLLNRFENRSEMNEKKLTMLDNRTTNLYHRVEDMEPGRGSPPPSLEIYQQVETLQERVAALESLTGEIDKDQESQAETFGVRTNDMYKRVGVLEQRVDETQKTMGTLAQRVFEPQAPRPERTATTWNGKPPVEVNTGKYTLAVLIDKDVTGTFGPYATYAAAKVKLNQLANMQAYSHCKFQITNHYE